MVKKTPPILVSACLAGVSCRYDGCSKERATIRKLVEDGQAIAVCPEELGGLSTPRAPAEKCGDKIINQHGRDVTLNYLRGAEQALKIAQEAGCTEAHLKSLSPMCGVGEIYDGHFNGEKIQGDGVLVELLRKHGITPIRID
jgi:uncharacterized protein YbbK (DUF523 family)